MDSGKNVNANKDQKQFFNPTDVKGVLAKAQRPSKMVVTAGMPYANGPLHLGHLAGAHVPADIFSRYMRMLIGAENVLFVNGNDDHGSTSEVAALQAGREIHEYINSIHVKQKETLKKYAITTDIFSGTSRPETYPLHEKFSQDFMRTLYKNGMLEKRVTKQWYDLKMTRFLQDRFVRGTCPSCQSPDAYSDQCDACGASYNPSDLTNVRSMISDSTPELRDTAHWWLDMWKVADPLKIWIESKQKSMRSAVYSEVSNFVLIGLQFQNIHEPKYKEIKDTLPKHKSHYISGKRVECLFSSKEEMLRAQEVLSTNEIPTVVTDNWSRRPITRDVSWGIPVPPEIDPEMKGKTLYVWPDSLIAPIVFTQAALKQQGRDVNEYKKFWCDPNARVAQFLGQDNVFFYVIMQGSMWLGTQADILRQPIEGELQMTEALSVFHLMVNGEKMSKSKGNFYTGDQLIDEKGYSADQIRYFLAVLSLAVKPSDFNFALFEERNKFLAGPMNAAFEKPISAANAKFDGIVPEGKLLEKVEQETVKIVQKYIHSMGKADYPVLLGQIENYARLINSMFTQYKPHDDRAPEAERKDALYSCFYILKNLMIMLYPFVPTTMETLCDSLNLSRDVFNIDNLGTDIPAGHKIGAKQTYFPAVAD
ncbi:class I tRNA ligase family protein [bacterium]|nr:class I tRNA ligase family protein [bacterium]